jgi:hypothetical protein
VRRLIALLSAVVVPGAFASCDLEGSVEALSAEMLQSGPCADQVFERVGDGKQSSIELGIALDSYLDGGLSLMLADSLGWSMLSAPSRVLPHVGKELKPRQACFPILALEGDGYANRAPLMESARRMFGRFEGTSLESQARLCLKALDAIEREYAPPNNAFEPSVRPPFWRAAGALREFAPAARSDRRRAAAQRGR